VVACHHSLQQVGLGETLNAFGQGLLTFGRVLAVVGGSTLIFLPLAVLIGLRPRWAALLQPVMLMLASIPANLLFPFFTVVFLFCGMPLFYGCVVLMAMGAQWYVLFNVTAGASAIPNDLREMSQVFQLKGRQRWKRFLLPAMFSAWITGAVTASGAAWNASIVAELRERFEDIRRMELAKRQSEFSFMTAEQWEMVESLTRSIVAKIAHQPTLGLKDSAGTDRGQRLTEALRNLFDL
jgi:NitT/TauT family transport system permease protein